MSTEGAVDSIQLITRRPLEQVRTVAVTPESATSVVLTKVLLGDVELVPLDQPADARMLIGDAALRSAFEDPTPHYDLGRLWQERTGLPMVYAVWACRKEVEEGLRELERAHLRSLAVARSEPEALARQAAVEYGWPAGFLARYFEKLRYHFGPRERQGVVRFFELAHLAGELDSVPELRFVELAEVAGVSVARGARPRARGRAAHRRRRCRAPAVARPGGGRQGGPRAPKPPLRPRRGHVHRRPQPELLEHLLHRLLVLRLLPPARRHARGLRAAAAR